MQTSNRILDDMARVATGAVGALSGVREEIEQLVRTRIERFLSDMDLVTREEFDAVKALASKARSEQEALEKRVAVLEAALKDRPKTAKPAARKAAPKSAATGKKNTD